MNLEEFQQPYSNHLSQYSNDIMNDLDDIKKKLREIFNYYASFGDRLNVSNLKSAKFHKMMNDAKIINSSQ